VTKGTKYAYQSINHNKNTFSYICHSFLARLLVDY